VISDNRSGRDVTEEYGICHASFHWFCIMLSKDKTPKMGYRPHNRVFDSQQEGIFRDYVKRAANLYYGLSTRDLRTLACQCAVHCI
jgi:hypothetical protein